MYRTILFDNWGLELSKWALSQIPTRGSLSTKRTNLSYVGVGVTEYEGLSIWEDWIGIMALANLLDALVLYDKVAFPEPMSDWWRHRIDRLEPLLPMLKMTDITPETYAHLRLASEEICSKITICDDSNSLVSEGSIFYILLGAFIDSPYQPSPKRADFLSGIFLNQSFNDSAHQHLLRFFEDESVRICAEIREAIGIQINSIRIPVFASFIFGQVKTKEDIGPLLIEIRSSRERRALVEWLDQMNALLEKGDVVSYAKEFMAVRDLFNDLRKSIGLKESESGTVSLGLSPSLNVNLIVLSKLFHRQKPHTILLKRFADHLLSSRTYAKDVHRLFGTKAYYVRSLENALRKRFIP